jgi:hypothetical protein
MGGRTIFTCGLCLKIRLKIYVNSSFFVIAIGTANSLESALFQQEKLQLEIGGSLEKAQIQIEQQLRVKESAKLQSRGRVQKQNLSWFVKSFENFLGF